MSQLPAGWTETSLCGVARLISGAGFPVHLQNKKGLPYPFFKVGNLADVQAGQYLLHSEHTIDADTGQLLRAKIVPKDAIVFAKIGMAIKLNRRRLIGAPSYIDNNLMAALPSEAITSRYLLRFLETIDFMPLSQSTTVPALRKSDLNALNIPLPPLNEQQRIVAKLEKLLSRVHAAQEHLATIPRTLKRFRQSVLAAACSGRLTADWRKENETVEPTLAAIEVLRKSTSNVRLRRGVPDSVPISGTVEDWDLPPTWGCYSAAELLRVGAFVDVKDGNHGSNHPKVSEFSNSGLPFITAAQINNYRVDYEGAYKVSGKPLERLRVGFAKSGDVVYTHKGSVGRVALINRECILTPQTTYYRVSPDIFLNSFLMYYLSSHAFAEQVNVVKEQTTRDFVPISEQYLLFHRVPPLPEQHEIVRRVEALFRTADALEARYLKAKVYVDKLTQSVLAKAFRGELVPQDPNDEPASVLLERIAGGSNGSGSINSRPTKARKRRRT